MLRPFLLSLAFALIALTAFPDTVHADPKSPGAACNANSNVNSDYGVMTCVGGVLVANPVAIGTSALTCGSTYSGFTRYNSTTQKMEYCNGSAWSPFSSGSGYTGTCTGSAGSNTSLASGLVAYYNFDQNAGTTVLDIANSNPGAWSGTLGSQWSAPGKLGASAGNFDGSTNYVNLSSPTALEGLQVPLTIAGWFYTTSSSGFQPIYGAYQNAFTSGQLWSMVRIDNGTLVYYTSSSSSVYQYQGTFTPTLNQWHFFAVTVSGSLSTPSVTIYLDGSSQNFTYTALNSSPASIPIYIGSDVAGGEYFAGKIDDIGVWNIALSSTQIATLYNSGTGNAYGAPYCPAATSPGGFTN